MILSVTFEVTNHVLYPKRKKERKTHTSENTVIFNKPVRLHVVLHLLANWRTKQVLEVLFESVICFLSYCGINATTQHVRVSSQAIPAFAIRVLLL